jgi:cold shock protein
MNTSNTSNTKHTGKVLFYNTERAYGFIIDDVNGKSVFVHRTSLIDSIKKDDEVTFETMMTNRGLMATDVRVINKYIIIIENKKYDEDNKRTRQ